MRTNPGGQIAPNEVLGRDLLIERLWQILERQSLVLTAERRMGKTTVVKKMAAEPQQGMRIFWRDVEELRSPLEFVDVLLQDVQEVLSRKQQTTNRVRDLLKQLNGAEFQGIKLPQSAAPHWKTLLANTLEDLAEHQEGMIVFCWDELPMMLDNIKQDLGEKTAMEVLDTLRSLRQRFTKIRMVFTGSIGLHHVFASLKDAGYRNAPTNDMAKQEVATLDLRAACDLAERLLAGESIDVEDCQEFASTIAQAVDCFPYYIHHVVDALKWIDQPKSLAMVEEIVSEKLCDTSDPWDLAHYHQRIRTYYAETEQRLVLAILDELGASEMPLALKALLERLEMSFPQLDPEQVRYLLNLLGNDHYLMRESDGPYRFKFGLIQRFWRLHRGL
jgi:hypothetical protein